MLCREARPEAKETEESLWLFANCYLLIALKRSGFAIKFQHQIQSQRNQHGLMEGTMNHAAFRALSSWRCIGQTILLATTVGALLFLASCTNRSATGPHATVLMRDGTTLTGTVTATSPTEITLAGDDKTNHTVPMTQVKSIEYDDAAQGSASST